MLDSGCIAKALRSRTWRSISAEKVLDDLLLRRLHKAMFGDVWRWAGEYRLSEKDIGCHPRHISVKVRDLCADAAHCFADTRLSTDEAVCKFHLTSWRFIRSPTEMDVTPAPLQTS